MSAPTTVNTVATIANDIEKVLICDVAATAIYAALVEEVPFFGLPVISTLTRDAIGWIMNKFYVTLGTETTFAIIAIQTNSEVSATNAASTALRTAMAAGDVAAINKASADFKQAFGSLIKWDGSAQA